MHPTTASELAPGITPLPCNIPGKRAYNIRGVPFTVDERYRVLKPIGIGAYGVVISAFDTLSNRKVALKKVSNVFEDLTDAKRVLREIRLMQAMCHDNVCRLQFRTVVLMLEVANDL